LSHDDPLYKPAAIGTRFAMLTIDREHILKTALEAFGVDIVARARAAHLDGAAQNVT
jgi:hypothetical protein